MSEELIVFVDEENRPIGTGPKLASHNSDTRLHRAFSCFVFRADGRFLLTQRALNKKVFPGVWTNSCCGHPGPEERAEDAVRRRLQYELGLAARRLTAVLPDFRYRAEMDGIVENELCPVFLAIAEVEPKPNPLEVEAYKWVDWSDFVKRCREQPESLSVWSVMETYELERSDDFRAFMSKFRA
jgi:isopentenyl-diphosphate delta-isomerase